MIVMREEATPPIGRRYKPASSQFRHGERTVIDIDGRKIGGSHFATIAGFESAYRFTLDLMAVGVLKELTLAAAAAGADGIIVEVHPDPDQAICDGPQQLHADDFGDYLRQVERVAEIAGKRVAAAV